MTIAVFNSIELYVLKKIWEELAERSDHMGVGKQIFLKYIPVNGLLGERLFLQFDKDNNGYISQENFLDGLAILCLGTVSEQSRFLFEVFDVNNAGSILKKDLITILNYIPSDIFCNCNKKRSMSTDSLNDFMFYTNYCYCENAFTHEKECLDYEDFHNWVKHTPALLGYIKSVIPCMSEDNTTDTNNKFIMWKKGEKTGFMIKRFFILKGNCLYYYYNKQDTRPKGIIFLSGCIISQFVDSEMELKGNFGLEIIQQHEEENPLCLNHHSHEKRIFFCESREKRDELINELQHSAHIIPFDNDYQIIKKIGIGAFSEVFECEHNITKERCAVKVINKKIFEKVSRVQLNNEIAILKLVNHPNIIHLKETYENKENIYIVLELIKDGDFFDFITERPCFKDNELRTIMKQLFEAIAYLHEYGIVHYDIKPENILYDKSTGNIIKLTDFGLSKMILSDEIIDGACGTLPYVAPEILCAKCSGMEADMWSIGTIMYLLTNGKLPYVAETVEEVLMKMSTENLSFRSSISENSKNLMLALLEKNPKKRISAKDALLHEFITEKET